MPTHNNRHRQTLPDTPRHCQVLFEYAWQCPLASVVVMLCSVETSGGVWGVSGGCLGGVLWVIIETYRLTKSKMAVEGAWKVSEGYLGGVWRVSGGVWRVSGGV